MSLYDDITNDIITDIYGGIPEIEVTLDITEFGESDYDPITGVDTREETIHQIRAIKLEDVVGENINKPTKTDMKEYLILDQDLNGLVLVKGMVVNDIYSISGIESDPITATWNIICRLSSNA